MNRLLLLIAIACIMTLSASAQDVDKLPSITLTGTAEVSIAPDEVTFSLDVTKMDKDLQVAKRQNDEVVVKVLELARRFGIDPKDVKTDNISVTMKYESVRDPKKKIYDEDGDEIGTRVFRGYEVSKTVDVKLLDLSRFEEFFSESLKTGITETNSVSFTTSKLRATKDQARDMAMKAAKEKATAMAASIGQTIGKAVRISEGNTVGREFNLYSNTSANSIGTIPGGSVSETLATFAPGAIKVEAQVTVSFLLN